MKKNSLLNHVASAVLACGILAPTISMAGSLEDFEKARDEAASVYKKMSVNPNRNVVRYKLDDEKFSRYKWEDVFFGIIEKDPKKWEPQIRDYAIYSQAAFRIHIQKLDRIIADLKNKAQIAVINVNGDWEGLGQFGEYGLTLKMGDAKRQGGAVKFQLQGQYTDCQEKANQTGGRTGQYRVTGEIRGRNVTLKLWPIGSNGRASGRPTRQWDFQYEEEKGTLYTPAGGGIRFYPVD